MTYDDIWVAMSASKALHEATKDPLVKSGIKILAGALTRVDDAEVPVALTMVEEDVINGVHAMQDAYFCLYGKRLT